MTTMNLNVIGKTVNLVLKQVDPDSVILDPNNPRIAFLLDQLSEEERTESAIAHLLFTQEDVTRTKKSIFETNGVQEPIFLRHNGVVAEGNRRITALRELKREHPKNPAFQTVNAWVFPDQTSETIVQDAINNFHLNHKRPWTPYERALIIKKLHIDGATIVSLASRFEMKEDEVRQFIDAVDLMQCEYIPLLDDPHDPDTRSKFSYFVEYIKNPRNYKSEYPHLDTRFAKWVHNGTIPKAEKVRRLGKILSNPKAILALEDEGFEAAIEILIDENPNEDPQFKAIDKATRCLRGMSPSEILDLRSNTEKQAIIQDLAKSVQDVLQVSGI